MYEIETSNTCFKMLDLKNTFYNKRILKMHMLHQEMQTYIIFII